MYNIMHVHVHVYRQNRFSNQELDYTEYLTYCIYYDYQVIRDEDLESDKEKWIEWLENEQIVCEEKLKVLCGRDGKGWTALHHAARHSCTEILSCAADVEGGQYIHT